MGREVKHKVVTMERGSTPDGAKGYAAYCQCGCAVTFGGFRSRTAARAAVRDSMRVLEMPTTPAGLARYDSIDARDAAVLAWTVPGINPTAHGAAMQIVRDSMPVLARALDRAARETFEQRNA